MFCPIINTIIHNDETIRDIKDNVNFTLMNHSTFGLDGTDQRLIDNNVRSSKSYTCLLDKDQMAKINKLLDKINNSYKENTNIVFSLNNNEMNIIQYEVGDHFEFHKDKTNSNNEFTMSVALDARCIGGELLFDLGYKYGYLANCSNITNGIAIFNKSINHKVLPIKKGKRLVATLNLQGKYYSIISKVYANLVDFNIHDRNYLLDEDRKMTQSEYYRHQVIN